MLCWSRVHSWFVFSGRKPASAGKRWEARQVIDPGWGGLGWFDSFGMQVLFWAPGWGEVRSSNSSGTSLQPPCLIWPAPWNIWGTDLLLALNLVMSCLGEGKNRERTWTILMIRCCLSHNSWILHALKSFLVPVEVLKIHRKIWARPLANLTFKVFVWFWLIFVELNLLLFEPGLFDEQGWIFVMQILKTYISFFWFSDNKLQKIALF